MSPQLRFYAYTVGDEDRDALKRQLWRGEAPERKSILVLSQEQQPWLDFFSHCFVSVEMLFFYCKRFLCCNLFLGESFRNSNMKCSTIYIDGIQYFSPQTKWWGNFGGWTWADWSGGLGIPGFKKLFGAFHARCRLGDFLISLKFVHVDIPPPKKKTTHIILWKERLCLKKTSCWVSILS